MAPKGKAKAKAKGKAKKDEEAAEEKADDVKDEETQDVEMKDGDAKEEEVKEEAKEETKEEAKEDVKDEAKDEDMDGKDAEAPAKMQEETDSAEDKRPKVSASDVCFNMEEATCNAMPAADGRLLMTLCDGGFQYLFAGVRCRVGVKAGRYMFETKVVETLNPSEGRSNSRSSGPRHTIRLGFALSGSSPVLDESLDKIYFDSEGNFAHGRKRDRQGRRFGRDQIIALVLNLDAASPNANTVSLFLDGQRASDPQPLPENLVGKTLYPCITYQNVTLHVNFGPTPKKALPFKCRMLKDAAAADVDVSKQRSDKNEVLFPVGLPDQGLFDWADGFLEKHPNIVELSDRKVIEWARNSQIYRQRGGYNRDRSNDKPGMEFGISLMDDGSIQKTLASVAPALKRDFLLMELKANLIAEERKKALARFPGSTFKKVAVVAVGEPPEDFKAKTQERLLADKKEKAEWEKQRNEKRKHWERDTKARKDKGGEDADAAKGDKEGDEEADGEPKEEEAEEEDKPVELTEEEKKTLFYKGDYPDLSEWDLAKSFASFTLPTKEEGFDEIRYVWSSEEKAAAHVKSWMLDLKKTQRAEDLEPSQWFHDKYSEWSKQLRDWQGRQRDARHNSSRKEEKKEEDNVDQIDKVDGDDGEKDGEEKAAKGKGDNVDEELDVNSVEDVNDVGKGVPLFANFAYEDWTLLALRFELHLLCHAFKQDLNDPDRPGFAEEHLAFYYNKYYRKSFEIKWFNVKDLKELIDLIKETQSINAESGFLEAVLPADAPMDKFMRISEEHRRDRQRCVDAGDETANLKFERPPSNHSYRGQDRGSYRGGGGSAGGQSGGYRGGQAAGGGSRGAPARGAPPPRGSYHGGSHGSGGHLGGGGSRSSYPPPSRNYSGGSSQGQKRPAPAPPPSYASKAPRYGGGGGGPPPRAGGGSGGPPSRSYGGPPSGGYGGRSYR